MHEWNRDKLLLELSKFSFSKLKKKSKRPDTSEMGRYQQFYGLDQVVNLAGVKHTAGWFDAGDYRLVLQCYVPENAAGTVFLFHGYFDHLGIYKHLIHFLVENGFAVIAYDMPGHGLSSGEPTSIDCFSRYQEVMSSCLEFCEGKVPEPFHCIGQSTGGAVLIDRLSNSDIDGFDKVVLLAPLVRPKDWTLVKGLHKAINPFLKIWYRSFSENSNDLEFVNFVKKDDPLQAKWMAVDWVGALKKWVPVIERTQSIKRKVLIIQGNDDTTVDWRHNMQVLKRLFNEVKIVHIQGGRHHLVNEEVTKREQVFSAILTELNGRALK